MPRDFYDEMMIRANVALLAAMPRAEWIDRCTMALGRRETSHDPERLAAVAAGLYGRHSDKWPDEAARTAIVQPGKGL